MARNAFPADSVDVAELARSLHVPIGILQGHVAPDRLQLLLHFAFQSGLARGRQERDAVYNDILHNAGARHPVSAPVHQPRVLGVN